MLKNSDNDQQNYREMCYKCCRPKKSCSCHLITPFETRTRFCLLMHPKEAKLAHVGTGRMSQVALKNSELIIDENFDNHPRVQALLNDSTYFPLMLYPGEGALDISSEQVKEDFLEGRIPLIFILDGTWPSAKSMFRDSKTLHDLPRISFSHERESRYTIRHQPAKFCLSTIESIYLVIENLERIGWENVGDKKECLLEALDYLVQFQIKCSLDPSLQRYKRKTGTFKKPEDRVSSKRWDHRKICYEEKNYSNQKNSSK